jgi:hypothetical protein
MLKNVSAWFPTLICDFESQTHAQFKDVFYNNMSKYVHPEGIDGEHADIVFHHNTEFDFFFKEITDFSKQYLAELALDPEKYDLHLVKCWWQGLSKNHIPMHNHSDAHLSFVYYANVPPESGHLHFQTNPETFPNDLTKGLFLDDYEGNLPIKEYNGFNAMSVAYEVKEAKVIIFPASINHMTTDFNGMDEITTDVDIIKKRRISIAGDFLITYKESNKVAMGLQPVKNWRKFDK